MMMVIDDGDDKNDVGTDGTDGDGADGNGVQGDDVDGDGDGVDGDGSTGDDGKDRQINQRASQRDGRGQ